ncbi:MAG: rRNA maturation RNase YbeY [Anaerolineae bacterium]|nr:rRNA maturation RNase YbeY [Anaerolineae bacterium]
MAHEIEVLNEAGFTLDADLLCAAATCVLNQEHVTADSAMTIVISDDAHVASLNKQYRGIGAATDILSFPADAPPIAIPDELPYLGDLIIAYPYASAQAAREGHVLSQSLALLVVHGTLHLLGYDHDSPEQRASMWQAQATALATLGIPLDYVPTLENSVDDHHG